MIKLKLSALPSIAVSKFRFLLTIWLLILSPAAAQETTEEEAPSAALTNCAGPSPDPTCNFSAIGEAQQGAAHQIYIVNRAVLFENTKLGQDIAAELAREEEELRAESAQIDAELEQEERQLAAARESLSDEEFDAQAQAFDAKVVTMREEQNLKSSNFAQQARNLRVEFEVVVNRVLGDMLADDETSLVMDSRFVLWAAPKMNITAELIAAIDTAYEKGLVRLETISTNSLQAE